MTRPHMTMQSLVPVQQKRASWNN